MSSPKSFGSCYSCMNGEVAWARHIGPSHITRPIESLKCMVHYISHIPRPMQERKRRLVEVSVCVCVYIYIWIFGMGTSLLLIQEQKKRASSSFTNSCSHHDDQFQPVKVILQSTTTLGLQFSSLVCFPNERFFLPSPSSFSSFFCEWTAKVTHESLHKVILIWFTAYCHGNEFLSPDFFQASLLWTVVTGFIFSFFDTRNKFRVGNYTSGDKWGIDHKLEKNQQINHSNCRRAKILWINFWG